MDNPSFSNVYVLTSLFFDSKGNIKRAGTWE
jgi:hypothetical protein